MKIRHEPVICCLTIVVAASVLGIAGCGDTRGLQGAATTRTIGTAIDDNVIKAEVKSALFADPDVKAFDLKVDARRGEVQLSGFVDNQAEIDRAISLARNVEGVTSIDNKVTLKTGMASIGNKVDDSITTATVKSALLADSSVHGLQIGVATRKGVVQLSGFVDNRTQAERAVAIARGTDGVVDVSNEMTLTK
jgi:hyperosmotically inducible protein